MRACGDCTLCCKLPAIKDFKEGYSWCKNCDIGKGCKIYETRPKPCIDFDCMWKDERTNEGEHRVGGGGVGGRERRRRRRPRRRGRGMGNRVLGGTRCHVLCEQAHADIELEEGIRKSSGPEFLVRRASRKVE